MDLSGYGLPTLAGMAFALMLAQVLACALYGAAIGSAGSTARIVLWPVTAAVFVVTFPGTVLGYLSTGYMTPPFAGQNRLASEQKWIQRGLGAFLEALAEPWTSRQVIPPSEPASEAPKSVSQP